MGDLIDEMVLVHGSRAAFIGGGEKLSYSELAQASRSLARSFLAIGVRAQDRICILSSNRAEFVIAYLACARVGAVFAPLNTWYRERELAWSLGRLAPVLLLAEPAFAGHDFARDLGRILPGLGRAAPGELHDDSVPSLRSIAFIGPARAGGWGWEQLLDLGREVPVELVRARQAGVAPDSIFQILFTSGSTADPKGVLLNHRSTVQNCFQIGERRALAAGDLVWFGSPLFYALGAVNCLPAVLTHGATLVTQARFVAEEALDTIERLGCNVFYATSNIIRAVFESSAFSRRRVASLEKGMAGISVAERRILIQDMGAHLATQSFGMTEVYGHCAVGHPDDALELKLTSEGCALPGNELRVVDPLSRRPLPAGELGLLTVRGHTADGYYLDPGASAQAWDQDGFLDTGDLGRLDLQGYFHFHSRLKEVIKTGGMNVAPADLEQVLLSHPAIVQACVVGIPDLRRGEVVIAFVASLGQLSEDEVCDYVRSSTASFKVPSRVVFKDGSDFPRLASGKIPRHRLREEAIALFGGGSEGSS